MADYLYTLETRLSPDQQKGVTLVQDVTRVAGLNVYLTGGAVRDIITGFPIRDLDFSVQGNPLRLQKEFEKAGARIAYTDDDTKCLSLVLPGRVRAEVSMARSERHEKTGKPPIISPASMAEDLRRRDFTVNAMALSLNPGSRGLLMDPFNGVADIEAKLLRVLHNYAFVEDPSRLIRATRFMARFHWPLEERTQARFDSARENNYIEHITNRATGYEIEQLAHEEDALNIIRVYEKEGWLKVLHPHWTTAKVDAVGLLQLMKSRQQMNELGYWPDPAPAVLHFLTARMGDKDISDIRKLIPNRDLVEGWRDLQDNAKSLAKRLTGKEAATPSRTWKLLSDARPEMVLFLSVTAKQQAVAQKIKNFFTKWRQVQQRLPLPEMTELLITPQLGEYPKIANDVFLMLLDGKLRSRTEIMKYLKPFAPPPPPPPPPPPARRGRAAKAAAASASGAGKPAPGQPVAAGGSPPQAKQGASKRKGSPAAAVPAAAVEPSQAAPAKVGQVSRAEKESAVKSASRNGDGKRAEASPPAKPAAAPKTKKHSAAKPARKAKGKPAPKPAKKRRR